MEASAEDILSKPQPHPDERVAYGTDPNQFIEVRLPHTKGPHRVLINIHGGFWRAKYDLVHAGHLCEAFRQAGLATFNVEYRRVGNPGGGWPGTFADIRAAYRFIQQHARHFHLNPNQFVVMGHSAGGQLAFCLAAHEPSLQRVISLAGVVDLKKAYALHLSKDAVSEFMGGPPDKVPEHYAEADPMEEQIPHATEQWLIHGTTDEVVPVQLSRDYVTQKKAKGESAALVEIPQAGHFDLINPNSNAFEQVKTTALKAAS